MAIEVRRGTADDMGTVAALHRASILELCRTHYTAEQLAQWTGALEPHAYERLLGTRAFFVAVDGGVVRGFGMLDLQAGLVNATYVSPDAVRRGVGRGLVATMEELARASGLRHLSLHATLNAVGFYQALGFAPIGPSVNTLPNGVELPCVVMRKIIDPDAGNPK